VSERGARNKPGPREPNRWYRCPDCDLRDNHDAGPTLNSVGVPRLHPDFGFSLALHCEVCKGTGRLSDELW